MGMPLMESSERDDTKERVTRLEERSMHQAKCIEWIFRRMVDHPQPHQPAPTHSTSPITDGTWWVLVKFAAAVVLMVAAALLAASGQSDLAIKLGGAVKAMP